jgi:hypothetical protein
MPPLHHKGIAGAAGPPEPDDPRNGWPEKEPLPPPGPEIAHARAWDPSPGLSELRIMVSMGHAPA